MLALREFVAPLPAASGERVPKAGEGPCHEAQRSKLGMTFTPSSR